MNLQHVLNYEAEDARHIYLGIVGQGSALDLLVKLLGRDDFTSAFPHVRVAGWVPTPGRMPSTEEAESLPGLSKLPIFMNISTLFSAQPAIFLAVDVSPDSRHMESLRAEAPPNVSLITADAVIRLYAAMEEDRLTIGDESLRTTQKLFALLVDQLHDDVLILDKSGIILDINQHAAESRGLTREEIIGKECMELDGFERICLTEEGSCPFKAARETGKESRYTFTQVKQDGRVSYINALCYPVADAFGTFARYLYIFRDVTEQHHLEQRLQQAEKMAAIGELSTYMAHEIRNPLFSIGGFANALLRNPSLNDLAREKARIIYDESRRLDLILASILNFARPMEQAMGVVDVLQVAQQTMDIMTIGAEERGLHGKMDIQSNLPKAQGNAENLKQCLVNLVKNAMEAMPEGGTFILRAQRNGAFVQLDVEDTGKGISPEIQDKIFSPFFSTKHEGAGLGLAMTRKVIEDMGGKVTLDSQVGKGTRVSLFVPVALALNSTEESPLPPELAP